MYILCVFGLFSNFVFTMRRRLACCVNLQPGGPVIFYQGILPLVLGTPLSNSKLAVSILVRPGYFVSLAPAVSGEHSSVRPQGRRRRKTNNSSQEGIRRLMNEKGTMEEYRNDIGNWRRRII